MGFGRQCAAWAVSAAIASSGGRRSMWCRGGHLSQLHGGGPSCGAWRTVSSTTAVTLPFGVFAAPRLSSLPARTQPVPSVRLGLLISSVVVSCWCPNHPLGTAQLLRRRFCCLARCMCMILDGDRWVARVGRVGASPPLDGSSGVGDTMPGLPSSRSRPDARSFLPMDATGCAVLTTTLVGAVVVDCAGLYRPLDPARP